jgi:hypothetical protein
VVFWKCFFPQNKENKSLPRNNNPITNLLSHISQNSNKTMALNTPINPSKLTPPNPSPHQLTTSTQTHTKPIKMANYTNPTPTNYFEREDAPSPEPAPRSPPDDR